MKSVFSALRASSKISPVTERLFVGRSHTKANRKAKHKKMLRIFKKYKVSCRQQLPHYKG